MPVISTISPETVDKDENGFIRSETFVTNGGLKLSIEPTPGGLYHIVPNGGGTPPTICDEHFTSYLRCRGTLVQYIQDTDRLGYAQYPGKPEAQQRKAKFPKANHVEEETKET